MFEDFVVISGESVQLNEKTAKMVGEDFHWSQVIPGTNDPAERNKTFIEIADKFASHWVKKIYAVKGADPQPIYDYSLSLVNESKIEQYEPSAIATAKMIWRQIKVLRYVELTAKAEFPVVDHFAKHIIKPTNDLLDRYARLEAARANIDELEVELNLIKDPKELNGELLTMWEEASQRML